jgi:hypothetical protein
VSWIVRHAGDFMVNVPRLDVVTRRGRETTAMYEGIVAPVVELANGRRSR